MKYFGHTHQAFLVLSRLNSKTRNNLNEFYNEFVKEMNDNLIRIHVGDECFWRFGNPTDLFEFEISIQSKEEMENFLQFLENLTDMKGLYFKEHSMNQRLNVNKIEINANLIEYLYPYVELLKSTKISITKKIINKRDIDQIQALIDRIYVRLDYNGSTYYSISQLYSDENLNIFTSFKNITSVFLIVYPYEEWIEQLKIIKNSAIKIGIIFLQGYSEQELEDFTNPDYYNKCDTINYYFKAHHTISIKTLENINKIKPVSIKLETHKRNIENDEEVVSFDLVKFISKLKEIESVNFAYYSTVWNWSLTFSNTLIKIWGPTKK